MVMVRPTIERRCYIQFWESLSKLIANIWSDNNLRCPYLCLLELRMARQCGCRLEIRKSSSPSSEQTFLHLWVFRFSFLFLQGREEWLLHEEGCRCTHRGSHLPGTGGETWKDWNSPVWVTYIWWVSYGSVWVTYVSTRPLLVERYEFKEYTKISTCKYLRALHRTQGARLNSLGTAQSALSPK